MNRNLNGLGGIGSPRRRMGEYFEYPFALSDSDGFVDFYEREGMDHPGQISAVDMLFKPSQRFQEMWPQIKFNMVPRKVKTFTLDTWAAYYGVQYADYAELDVQC